MMLRKIDRAQLLAVTGWSPTDLDNRAHANQLALAHGLVLPTAAGSYVGADCFALLLSDALVEAGFPRAQAAHFVLTSHDWLRGLERVEWPELFPPPVPMTWALTKRAHDEGVTTLPPPDANIYLAVAKSPKGDLQTASGTLLEIVGAFSSMMVEATPPGAPTQIIHINLRQLYDRTLAAAERAGIDLGAPFTRPDGHDEHKEWFAAVEVHRALSFARLKARKPPGPARAKKGKAKARTRAATKQRPARASAVKRLLKA